jgi:hypothetical protein
MAMAGKRRTLKFLAIQCTSAREAVNRAAATRGEAIVLDGRKLVVSPEDAEKLEIAGVYFAYLCDHHGQIMTVPVND